MRAFEEIVRAFGREILSNKGEIDRERLGRIVFNDATHRAILEEIVHPEVMKAIDFEVASIRERSSDAVIILDVPLLIETGMHEGLGEVVVVYCPEKLQIMRLMGRDGMSREEALARVRAQLSIEDKKRYASLIIDNSLSQDHTRRQVESVFERFREKAGGFIS
jgi:dephospho-CoA kinase